MNRPVPDSVKGTKRADHHPPSQQRVMGVVATDNSY